MVTPDFAVAWSINNGQGVGSAQLDTALAGISESSVYALPDDAALKFRHDH